VDFQLDLNSEDVQHAHPEKPLCVEPGLTIRKVMEKLKEAGRGSALICDDGKLAGIFTERDALKLTAQKVDVDQPVSTVMAKDPVTLQATATVGQAISKMSFGGYRHLPIVNDKNEPVGLLKVSGILNYLVEHFPSTIYNLPPKPHHSTQAREGA